MRRIALSLFLLTSPAMAQTSPFPTPSQILLQNAEECRANWLSQLNQVQNANAGLSEALKAMAKERDELKAKLEAPKVP